MNPKKLFNLTSPSKEMPGNVFKQLLENAKLEHGSDTDYYFKSKHGNYEILFGFDGETMSVDIFGFKHNSGDWIELEPNDVQIDKMKRKLDNVEPFQYEFRKQYQKYIDPYFDNGVSRENFY